MVMVWQIGRDISMNWKSDNWIVILTVAEKLSEEQGQSRMSANKTEKKNKITQFT